MKKILKITAYFISTVIVLGIILAASLYFYYRPTDPKTMTLDAPNGQVIITSDSFGIPHILALKDDNDAYYALGYMHARDRLWQIELQRRATQGTLSEIFGATTLKEDKFLRTLGFYRAAQTEWLSFSPPLQAMVNSYTAGVNAYIDTHRLPIEFLVFNFKPAPWTNIDSIAWQKIMAWNLQYSWQQKLTNYLIKHTLGEDQISVLNPPYPDSAPTILSLQDLQQSQLPQTTSADNLVQSDQNSTLSTFQNIIETDQQLRTLLGLKDAPGKGSNSWVFSGKLTKTGKPILANDPHLSLSAPSVWYLAELQGPGLHVIGATLPGVPAVVIGHNDHIAWGVTDVNPNAQDLYIEPQNATFNIIHDTIKIKGQKSVSLDIKISPEGPIISNINDTKKIGPNIALKSTSLMPNDTSTEAFMLIDYAQNWQDFRKALSLFVTPTQNFVYADTDGNIGYQMAGHIPIRSGWTGVLPVKADGEHQWDGFIPFDQLPYVYNPQKGFIVTANNKVAPDNYLYPIALQWFKPPYRAERIADLIATLKNNITMQDMQNMQQDVQDYFWRDLKTTLIATKPLNSASKEALQQLQNWNGDMSLNSTAATIFSAWTNELRLLVPEPIRTAKPVFDPLFIVAQLKNNGAYCKTSMHIECSEVLSQTLADAIKKLQKQFGDQMQNWQWQNVHHAIFKNLGIGSSKALGWLVNRSIATPGGRYTIDVASFPGDSLDQTEGASYREIIDLGDLNNSVYIQTLGQSGNPFSRHYDDQMKLWRDGKYLPMKN